jgi:superfamily II DNA/RNA helicase
MGMGFVGNDKSAQYRFWAGLDKEVPSIIHQFSKKRPTIVFCHSKAETEKLADKLATASGIAIQGSNNSDIASHTRIQKLQRVSVGGIGYHLLTEMEGIQRDRFVVPRSAA